MLLGALVDAGADLGALQAAVDAVVPGSVRLTRAEVVRAGQRATKVDVEPLVDDPPHRRWTTIRGMLEQAELAEETRRHALATFARLAEAEGHVHGTSAEDVHFHEVGALDSIADVVGVCEGLRLLGAGTVTATAIALGEGRIRAAHGDIPVPVPAVAQLAVGWPVVSGAASAPAHDHDHAHDHDGGHTHHHDDDGGGHHHEHGPADHHQPQAQVGAVRPVGELATPTGVALVRALASAAGPMPAMTLAAVGVGAGTKDLPGRPNVVRVLVGEEASGLLTDPDADAAGAVVPGTPAEVVQLEANVDDLDPRLWPGVLARVLEAGALDAWLSPILMKKGRPAHTLHALCPPGAAAEAVSAAILDHTTTLGVRQHAPLHRRVLERTWRAVDVDGQPVRIKVAHDGVAVRQATPEFDDVAAAADALGLPERVVLDRARRAALEARLEPGAPAP
ncbi:hypothetical protein ATJ97_3774 [Georgenia soli]|uniref:Pyridinium-3,5-bisthiocarboxylic acid mononucleotide nickel insertion protein n=2 Tax=Georgenia soli TaxID=638953 RepID=A0A2A9ERM6_9MICO|nr:hypothetical protein ATJ97_3774 [Georgenia soli]